MTPPARPMITRAWLFDDGSVAKADAASGSKQLPEDPFTYALGAESGLLRPLYDMDQLVGALESNTLHYRCVKQKASDVAGRGFVLRAMSDKAGGGSSDVAETTWAEFLTAVEDNDERSDESFKERVVQAHEDFESIGWGVLEFSRRADGVLDGMWYVPGHTVRAHADGRRYAQKRNGKLVWFKRFGVDGDVDGKGGGWSPRPLPAATRGNELLVVTNSTPRSSFYGMPDHIPALAALAGWRAQAEFNVRFFDRNAVPAYAVIIEGADLSPEVEEMIQEHFTALKGQPHKTLVLPVPGAVGDESSAPKVHFEKLAVEIKDASFRMYKQDNAMEICIAHGVPPYRVGWPIMGSLGGATALEMTQIYNDSIVQPRQETWEQRLTRAVAGVKGLNLANREIKANELDTRNEARDLDKARALWELNTITVNGLAAFFGLEQREDDVGAMYRDQLEQVQGSLGGFSPVMADLVKRDPSMAWTARWGAEVETLAHLRKRIEQLLPAEEPEAVAA